MIDLSAKDCTMRKLRLRRSDRRAKMRNARRRKSRTERRKKKREGNAKKNCLRKFRILKKNGLSRKKKKIRESDRFRKRGPSLRNSPIDSKSKRGS